MLKQIIKKILPLNVISLIMIIRNNYLNGYVTKSYSQEGEDMILQRIFENKSNGFYIDVGAHHPKRFSNTYLFYKKGWCGINIDAMPNSMKVFNKIRPRDINLEIPISDKKEILTYYMFNEPALNGFSKELTEKRDGLREYNVIATKDIQVFTLETVLDDYLPKNQVIDFMSIDVEGLDLKVLKSNNWKKYQPNFVLIEIINSSLSDLTLSEEYKYLSNIGYEVFAKTMNTVFFKRSDI